MRWLPLGEWENHRTRQAMEESTFYEVEYLRTILKDWEKAGGGFSPKCRVVRDFIRAYDDCL